MEEPKKDIPAENSELLKKLDEIRGRYRLLKIVIVVFALVFVVVAVFAVLLYKKISAAKQTFEAIQQVFPAPGLVKIGQENNSGVSSPGLFFSSGPASSSLTVFANEGVPTPAAGVGTEDSGSMDGEKTYKALFKYADRPIVKEFIAELKKDPSFNKTLANANGDNPMKVIADVRNIKGLDKLVAKFAFRPDFMKLMMEVMSDPELKPMMHGLPQGGMPAMAQIPAGEAPLPAQALEQKPAEPDSGSGMRFDPSVINGGAQSAPASVKRKAPPPI